MFLPRLLSALIAMPLVLLALFQLSLDGFIGVTLGICLLAAWEWGPLAGFTRYRQRAYVVMLVAGVLITLLYWVPFNATVILNNALSIRLILWSSVIWWFVAFFLVFRYPSGSTIWAASRCCRLLFGISTIVPFFCGVLVLRMQGIQHDSDEGIWWLLYVLILIWSADSGAYIIGKHFGKHALLIQVSPGKTWEGLLGGVVAGLLASYLFMRYGPLAISRAAPWIIGATLAVISSVLGDLTESMLKRAVGLKQSGKLIPGHGGILDRIDSLTAAIPIFACFLLLMLKPSH